MKEELPPLPDKMHNAFAELYERSLGLMEAVCPTSGVRPLQEILGPLQERTEAARPFFLQQTAHLSKWLQGSGSRQEQDGKGIGLNTVGMLSDRLSILAIKQHRLRLQERDGSAKAIDLFQTQTLDILAALSIARPGNSAINTKITTLPAEGQAANWIEAYFGLLTTNLLLWEAQEILYLKDILSLPSDELREYIQWFAVGNMRRNRYMELCELLFWNRSDRNDG